MYVKVEVLEVADDLKSATVVIETYPPGVDPRVQRLILELAAAAMYREEEEEKDGPED